MPFYEYGPPLHVIMLYSIAENLVWMTLWLYVLLNSISDISEKWEIFHEGHHAMKCCLCSNRIIAVTGYQLCCVPILLMTS